MRQYAEATTYKRITGENGMGYTTHQWVGFELAGVQHAAFGPCVWQSMMHKVVIVIGTDNLQRKRKTSPRKKRKYNNQTLKNCK